MGAKKSRLSKQEPQQQQKQDQDQDQDDHELSDNEIKSVSALSVRV